jgi:hypothetical protein
MPSTAELQERLERLGLSEVEARVYIALLRLGPSKAGRIKAQGREANDAAEKRMRKNRDSLKTVAHDYGNGNVKEVR